MMHKIGERICKLRKEQNMSQEELASTLNVSRQTVSKWETGDTLPDVYNAVAIANMFHVSLDALVLGSGSRYTGSSYIRTLKESRQKINIRAILVGSLGSLLFAMSIVLSDAFELSERSIAIVMAFVFPVLMFCWGFAIWNFIKISRIGEEIKFLQSKELLSISGKQTIDS